MTQQPRVSAGAIDGPPRRAGVDPIRLQQFLTLQQSLLAASIDADTLAEQLAQRVALFLGAHGAALGTVEDGCYRVIALYALEPAYRARYDGQAVADSEVGAALAAERPLVFVEPGDVAERHTLLIPFRTSELDGALHLVTTSGTVLADEDFALARALALLVGAELANARQQDQLAQVARLKSDALTAMAHDLRAPLNALLGYASLLGEGSFGPVTTEQRDVCATLERQANELVDLLSTTLDVARLESGEFPLRVEEFQLADVMANLCAGTFARATRTGRLRSTLPDDLPPLCTDRGKVKQIVQNLVDNALKHGDGSPVEVAASVAPLTDTLRITVQDHGRGIAPELLPHLFDPWRPGTTGGTGFGLYLVRSFTQALGGRVGASSAAGLGATLTVELPLSLADAPPSRRGA